MVMEGPAADHLQHCIVPQDVHAVSASVILRMLHPRQMSRHCGEQAEYGTLRLSEGSESQLKMETQDAPGVQRGC